MTTDQKASVSPHQIASMAKQLRNPLCLKRFISISSENSFVDEINKLCVHRVVMSKVSTLKGNLS
jgi:hypothetical protein